MDSASDGSSRPPWRPRTAATSAWRPLSLALDDQLRSGEHRVVQVLREDGRCDEMSTADLVRSDGMPEAEWLALDELSDRFPSGNGVRVLDIGAGAGAHALELIADGFDVTALEIDPIFCHGLAERGVASVVCGSVDAIADASADCALLLMNGLGLAGTLDALDGWLVELRRIVRPGGFALVDGCDLRLTDHEDELALVEQRERSGSYFGEAQMQLIYDALGGSRSVGEPFDWLYLDHQELALHTVAVGGRFEKLFEAEDGEYLARLSF